MFLKCFLIVRRFEPHVSYGLISDIKITCTQHFHFKNGLHSYLMKTIATIPIYHIYTYSYCIFFIVEFLLFVLNILISGVYKQTVGRLLVLVMIKL